MDTDVFLNSALPILCGMLIFLARAVSSGDQCAPLSYIRSHGREGNRASFEVMIRWWWWSRAVDPFDRSDIPLCIGETRTIHHHMAEMRQIWINA